jgi:hypothetical protein
LKKPLQHIVNYFLTYLKLCYLNIRTSQPK